MFGVAPILAANMILFTAFIDKVITLIEHKHRRDIPRIGRPVPILASFTEVTVAHTGFAKLEEDNKVVAYEVAKLRTVLQISEALLMMTAKSAGGFEVRFKRKMTVRTCLLAAQRIVDILSSKSS